LFGIGVFQHIMSRKRIEETSEWRNSCLLEYDDTI